MAARVGLFDVVGIGVDLRLDYAAGQNPWTVIEADRAEPLEPAADRIHSRVAARASGGA